MIATILKGLAMGIAETIPGVSGGTIAFITGIYENLLTSIKNILSFSIFTKFKKSGVTGVWQYINGVFLTQLLAGMVIGLGIGLFGISYLLEHYPPIVWAFFFGLIIASVWTIAKAVKTWTPIRVVLLLLSAVLAYGITILPVSQASENWWFVVLCGAIAVSALLLPGISGSFLLLILGMYQYILHDTLKEGVLENQDIAALGTMGLFGLGMVIGLASFSRVLSWALNHYHDATMAALTGFMLGALNKLWPWRIPKKVFLESGEVVQFTNGVHYDKVITELNVSPQLYSDSLSLNSYLIAAIISFIIGGAIVVYAENNSSVKR